ncbi:MAG: hypothetical protein ACKO5C_06305 [Ferruginibacter sp.]
MNVHLIKSPEMSSVVFTRVLELLRAVPGQITFFGKEDGVHTGPGGSIMVTETQEPDSDLATGLIANGFLHRRHPASWSGLFRVCDSFRKTNQLDADCFVILLTDIPNDKNWFAVLDENNPFNGFVHTADWPLFIDCPPAVPIAYEVLALLFRKHQFSRITDLDHYVHQRPIGCMNDFCMDKQDVILKLRTADICVNCMRLLQGKISPSIIQHVRRLMESLRDSMLFAQNSRQTLPLSRLTITRQYRLFLTDFDEVEIKLRPLEKALYLLFLKEPEGIYLSNLTDHKALLLDLYVVISNSGTHEEMKSRITVLVDVLSESASQKISRIKRVLEDCIGKDLAKHYIIRGETGQMKKIELDRTLVRWVQ